MRLIDADALWERLDYEPWENNADRDEIALPIVNAAPTIDAVPVVHGHRVEVAGRFYFVCSKCDGLLPFSCNFCPACGA